MRINEILIESQQVNEGPLMNKIGSAVGKGVGTLAKGVGAVAGGVAGLGRAIKKGYQAGKQTVGGAGDSDETDIDSAPASNSTATASTPTAVQPAQPAQTATSTSSAAKQPAAKSNFNKLTTAAAGDAPEPAAAPKADTAYAQAQKVVNALPPEQKQELIAMLQADPKVKASMTKPAAPKAKATVDPTAQPDAQPTTAAASKGKTGSTGGGVTNIGKVTSTTPAPTGAEPVAKGKKKGSKKPAGLSQAEIDADRERIMGVTSDSVIRNGSVVSESFSFFRKH
jgi:hypothetical protein